MTTDGRGHHHLNLLAESASGPPVREPVPVVRVSDGRYRLEATPALVDGCAAGDVVEVDRDGRVSVIERGGNLAIQSFAERGPFRMDQIDALREAFAAEGGLVEFPPHQRFVVVTVAARVGFPRVEAVMDAWSQATGSGWSFGNVYDEQGEPLHWW
ncbi:DUF4265 domain-containing protein [Actinomadura gamaensis]|uniref:DUF4265 domain-containing protein n=1 Tax=Actinomadura gamaensis TaxID=1763541 RepID=A0ABV9TRR4_9ACTN